MKIQIELDQITFIQNGNIINLLSVRDSNLTLTQISMIHSKIKNPPDSEERISLELVNSILNLSNSSFSYTDQKDEQQFISLKNSYLSSLSNSKLDLIISIA